MLVNISDKVCEDSVVKVDENYEEESHVEGHHVPVPFHSEGPRRHLLFLPVDTGNNGQGEHESAGLHHEVTVPYRVRILMFGNVEGVIIQSSHLIIFVTVFQVL